MLRLITPLLLFTMSTLLLVYASNATVPKRELAVGEKLMKHLFDDHNKDIRPVYSPNTPINVTFGIELTQLINVDDRNQLITSNIWVRQYWKNELLTWNPNDWGGIKQIKVDGEMVWSPDMVLYNNADEEFPGGVERFKTKITISSDGTNTWTSPAYFVSTCAIDIRHFPFDQQKCVFKFGSWTFTKTGINLKIDSRPLITSEYKNSSEWKIIEAIPVLNEVLYSCCPDDPFMDITFQFTLQRKPLYYVFNVILPCMVLVSTVLFGFFLPPESGERISLTITILLAVAVFLQLISDTLPRNSDTVPVLGVFYFVVMGESTLSLLTTIIVLILHHNHYGGKPLPQWARSLFLEKLATILCVHVECEKKVIYEQKFQTKTKSIQNGGFQNVDKDFDHEKYESKLVELLTNQKKARSNTQCNEQDENVTTLDAILTEIQVMTSAIKDKQKSDKIDEEWRGLGRVLDRLFFWIFFVTILISTLAILLPSQQVYN